MAENVPFAPEARDVRINVYWFLSLLISLSAALVGILCKQWIREYQRNTSVSSREAIALRHVRYVAFTKWGIPQMITGLPILLELSVVLFFVGVVEYLWALNHTVAIWASVVIGIVSLFIILTTILPSVFYLQDLSISSYTGIAPLPFKSPQSYTFIWLIQWIRAIYLSIAQWQTGPLQNFHPRGWTYMDTIHARHGRKGLSPQTDLSFLPDAMAWIRDTLVNNASLASHFVPCATEVVPAKTIGYLASRMDTSTLSLLTFALLSSVPFQHIQFPRALEYMSEIFIRALNVFSSIDNLKDAEILQDVGLTENRSSPLSIMGSYYYYTDHAHSIARFPEDIQLQMCISLRGCLPSPTKELQFDGANIYYFWNMAIQLSASPFPSVRDQASGIVPSFRCYIEKTVDDSVVADALYWTVYPMHHFISDEGLLLEALQRMVLPLAEIIDDVVKFQQWEETKLAGLMPNASWFLSDFRTIIEVLTRRLQLAEDHFAFPSRGNPATTRGHV